MNEFRDLEFQEQRLRGGIQRFKPGDQARILSALELARKAHQGQLRDEGDPFIIHPIRVANILIFDLNVEDAQLVVAGLLHDVVEDSEATVEEIKQESGERIGELVLALTRDKTKETKRDKFEKDLRGPADVRLVKTCDWLDNLRSLPYHLKRDERWELLRTEGKEMYIPLAEATGEQYLITEMEKAYSAVG